MKLSSTQVKSRIKIKSRIQGRINQFSAKTGNILLVVSMKGRTICLLMCCFKITSQISLGFGKPIGRIKSDELDHGPCPCRYILPAL